MDKRQRILLRDAAQCKRCGFVSLRNEVDHVIPLEQGGTDDDANLQTLCHECHAEKTAGEQRVRAGQGG